MSKLRLNGSTSGYAELTVSAVAGNNTVTLPSTNGTVVVESSSGAYVSGTLGVGVTNPTRKLEVFSDTSTTSPSQGVGVAVFGNPSTADNNYSSIVFNSTDTTGVGRHGAAIGLLKDGTWTGGSGNYPGHLTFWTRPSSGDEVERVRITSSGQVLVGTSTARTNLGGGIVSANLQVEGTNFNTSNVSVVRNEANTGGPNFTFAKSRSTSVGGVTVVLSGDTIGVLNFEGADGTNFVRAAQIVAQVDGSVGINSMPGRLIFSTTASGASTPTERMRITNTGSVLVGKTVDNTTDLGTVIGPDGYLYATRDSNVPLVVNRLTNDGILVSLRQASVEEGTISVSGTTVSYNGAHLSRWSQIPGIDLHDKNQRPEILRGTVMSNLDEMCEWGEEDNEQLNRMKVSDVEGDKNVSGVFQAWDDDDDTYTNDFYCAMTGDFIIRIAEGVTVERGDLLMSAGDGTAKPQDDDIIRSKTVAKVTSTHVTCTYSDGSYCVPCVLMAC